MFLTTKEYVFFGLIFAVLFFFSKAALYMGPKMRLGNTFSLFVMSFLGSLLLLLIFKAGNITNSSENFHFQVTPEKLCQGGPYMISSAPKEVQDYCYKLWSTPEGRCDYAKFNCTGPGYVGRPLHFERTPMSNDMWQNSMCDDRVKKDRFYPSVL